MDSGARSPLELAMIDYLAARTRFEETAKARIRAEHEVHRLTIAESVALDHYQNTRKELNRQLERGDRIPEGLAEDSE